MKILFSRIKCLLTFCIFVVGLFEIHRCIEIYKQNNSTITVYGLSDKVIESDHVIVKITLTELGDNIVNIGQHINEKIKSIKDILIQQGFKDTEISETGLNIWHDRWHEKKNNNIEVKKFIIIDTDDIGKVKKLDTIQTEFLIKNIYATMSMKYSIKNFDDIKLQLIREAIEDARNRAELISKTSGYKLCKLRNVTTGKFNIINADISSFSDCNWSDGESSYKKRLRLIITATYDKE